jgi:hypothetical protein
MCGHLLAVVAVREHSVEPLLSTGSQVSVHRTGSIPGRPNVQHPPGSGGGCEGRPGMASRAQSE